MDFEVVPTGRVTSKHKGFVLRQDRWNDYNFQTQYQLYWNGGDEGPELIGDVKILRKGQTELDGLQLELGQLSALDENFCSIGQALDYYERLAALGTEIRDVALKGLRDIVLDADNGAGFENEPGWRKSLFRYVELDDGFIQVARSLLTRDFSMIASSGLELTFSATGWDNPLRLDFKVSGHDFDPFDIGGNTRLPGRLIVLVGRNGSGKSTILARLARIVHASPGDRRRTELADIGTIAPPGVGFTRVIAIGYSAFDSFTSPGVGADERMQVAKEIREGTGRYMYCGLRDMAREMEDVGGVLSDSDRLPTNRLKSLDQITSEFVEALRKIHSSDRIELFTAACRAIFRDPSLYIPDDDNGIERFIGDDAAIKFHGLSTGHKLVLHTIASIVSHAQKRSIILFDEPETHLHPPLLAALMHALRYVIEQLDSFAVVATHSPIVVQETLSRHVHKVIRSGELAEITQVGMETFGENVGAISNEVFSLAGTTTDYHSILRALAEEYKQIEEVERLFPHGMSAQARAFVMTLHAGAERK